MLAVLLPALSCAVLRVLRILAPLQVMPSMRSMMTAGPALKKCNIAGYNCSYLPIDHPHAFDEVRTHVCTVAARRRAAQAAKATRPGQALHVVSAFLTSALSEV
jgi:hypothetical protein